MMEYKNNDKKIFCKAKTYNKFNVIEGCTELRKDIADQVNSKTFRTACFRKKPETKSHDQGNKL